MECAHNRKVHADVCLAMSESKKQLQSVDDMLLDFGETMTNQIKSLSRRMYPALMFSK